MTATIGVTVALLTPTAAAADTRGAAGNALDTASTSEQLATVDRTDERATSTQFDRIRSAMRAGNARVIVGLRVRFTPQGRLSARAADRQTDAIDASQRDIMRALAGTGHRVVHRFRTVPYIALALSRQALSRLESSGLAASVHEDALAAPTLSQSTPLVEATESAALGRTGAGQHVAVLDTGVDKAHGFLQQASGGPSKVVSEACYSANASCPGGVPSSTAVGSGVPCTYASACFHGTHVAGIASGRGAAFSGVARDSRLISINVFSRFTGALCAGAGEDPCALSFTSDQIAGLERVHTLAPSFPIASANMSLGGGLSAANCDGDPRKAAIDNLRSAGIATVIASGNSGSNTSVSFPSCISTAVTVGSTTKTDAVSAFSNSNPLVELLAPGSSIQSSVPGGGFGVASGTSMATPHVAGTWAVLKQISPAASVSALLGELQATGKPITDPDNAVTKPRIRVLSAGTRLADTGFRSAAAFALRGGDVASNGVGLATRAGGPAASTITISGIPAGAIVHRATLYWMTIGGPDSSAVFQGVPRTGTLVGASRDSCWNVNQFGPNRVYQHVLPVGTVLGNGVFSISGVGGVGGADGQGASLVVVYSVPTSPRIGRVYVRHGAMTAISSTMSHVFTGLTVPAVPLQARLHAGLADGQGFTEDPMLFAGVPISGGNFYSGKDGAMWDDDRLVVPPALLPAGTTTRVNSITGQGDCLAWGYAALAYQN